MEPTDSVSSPNNDSSREHGSPSSMQARESRQAGYDFPYDPTLEHHGLRSLSRIGLQAFFLGLTLGISLTLQALAAYYEHIIWRLFAFLACVAVFHMLEYWTTARFNSSVVLASSFLLFTNGRAYNIAYMLALVEILVSTLILPDYGRWLSSPAVRFVGFLLVLLGQVVRSFAMAHAGRSFNHTPQRVRKESHKLVTTGVYAHLRHPSYFGFFWWAVGTQMFVGNKICVLGYVIVLWGFFNRRIIGILSSPTLKYRLTIVTAEEKQLVSFFGQDYENFRKRTPTGIPFIK